LQIRKLADDWDGLGAEAPSSGIVDSAIDLLKKLKAEAALPAPSRAAAAPTGTVILEWQFGGTYLEAEITRPYYAEWMLQRPGQPARHWAMT
jgi:hypothetical protein